MLSDVSLLLDLLAALLAIIYLAYSISEYQKVTSGLSHDDPLIERRVSPGLLELS